MNREYNKAVINNILNSYKSLIRETGGYKFRSRGEECVGRKQTKVNREMLLDILSLKDTFMYSLDIIDDFLSYETRNNDMLELKKEIISKLDNLSRLLYVICGELSKSRSYYH